MKPTRRYAIVVSVFALLGGVACTCALFVSKDRSNDARLPISQTLSNWRTLTNSPEVDLQQLSIARVNSMCAEDLSGERNLDVVAIERSIQRMAERVASEMQRNVYQFRREPQTFENSEAYFRMLVLATVLHEDFGIRYSPERIGNDGVFESNSSFFADAEDVFIHGLLGAKRTGTCASIPVLYVAVGRQLNYPLKLVTAKNHLFVRWEDAKECRNFEVTGDGLNSFDDDYYRKWPLPMSAAEEKEFCYLKSLTRSQELGVFLSIRAQCLIAAGRQVEGQETLAKANTLMPIQFVNKPSNL